MDKSNQFFSPMASKTDAEMVYDTQNSSPTKMRDQALTSQKQTMDKVIFPVQTASLGLPDKLSVGIRNPGFLS